MPGYSPSVFRPSAWYNSYYWRPELFWYSSLPIAYCLAVLSSNSSMMYLVRQSFSLLDSNTASLNRISECSADIYLDIIYLECDSSVLQRRSRFCTDPWSSMIQYLCLADALPIPSGISFDRIRERPWICYDHLPVSSEAQHFLPELLSQISTHSTPMDRDTKLGK